MKRLVLLLVLPILATSCTKRPVTPIAPPPPKEVGSALPSVRDGNDGVDRSINENTKLKAELDRAYQDIHMQKVEIDKALDRIKELKIKIDNKNLDAVDVADIVAILERVKQRNVLLEQSNLKLDQINKNQGNILAEVKLALDNAEKLIIEKDNEATTLREQNNYYRSVMSKQQDEIADLNKDLDKTNAKLAKASVYRNWVIGLVTAIILWFVIKKALMIYAPGIGGRLW
jgi:chromosome segregation ATPase